MPWTGSETAPTCIRIHYTHSWNRPPRQCTMPWTTSSPLLAPLLRQRTSAWRNTGNALAALHGVQVRTEAGIDASSSSPGCLALARDTKTDRTGCRSPGPGPFRHAGEHPLCCIPKTLRNWWACCTIEGATQGGQCIARHIHQRPAPEWPCRFFDGYGAQTRPAVAGILGICRHPLSASHLCIGDPHCAIHVRGSSQAPGHLLATTTTREPVQSPARS